MQGRLGEALGRACAYVMRAQEPDGSFGCVIRDQGGREEHSGNAFITYLVLTALASCREGDEAWRAMLSRGARFARGELGEGGSANYWKRASAERSRYLYPDDLDDTALAYAAIAAHGGPLGGDALARLARMLPAAELAEGGPYNTWLIDRAAHPAWADADPWVNANIAFLLSSLDIRLPNLSTFVSSALADERPASRYYRSPLSLCYLAARAGIGESRDQARRALERERQDDGTWGDAFHTALALATLAHLGTGLAEESSAVSSVLAAQESDGGFPWGPLYLERGTKDGSVFDAGARAFTTALVIEAFTLAPRMSGPKPEPAEAAGFPAGAERFIGSCAQASPAFGVIARAFMEKLSADRFWRAMLELPALFHEALGSPEAAGNAWLAELGEAHAAGLAAYSILDDLADGEADPSLTPFAAFCLRRFAHAYARLIPAERFGIAERILSLIEASVHAEQGTRLARDEGGIILDALPDEDALILVEKSWGMALPVAAAFIRAGESDERVDEALAFFRHLLAARQWNDDAHDFIEDIAAGRATKAGVRALAAYRVAGKRARLNLPEDGAALRRAFWETAYETIDRDIGRELEAARAALGTLRLPAPGFLETLLAGEESALARTREERAQARAFLRSYAASLPGS